MSALRRQVLLSTATLDPAAVAECDDLATLDGKGPMRLPRSHRYVNPHRPGSSLHSRSVGKLGGALWG